MQGEQGRGAKKEGKGGNEIVHGRGVRVRGSRKVYEEYANEDGMGTSMLDRTRRGGRGF